jgi:antitoxin VapB
MIRRREEGDTAAVFMNGGSQAVRLPKEYRFEGDAVRIRREGRAVILEPMEKRAWPRGTWERIDALGPAPDDFVMPPELPPTPHRDEILRQFDDPPQG